MVKFGKKFFFNNTYIKKNRTFTIVIILVIASLILTTFFITSQFYNNNNPQKQGFVETHKEIKIKLFDNLPYMLTYFKTLENIKISDIKVTYPENFDFFEDTTNCTEEQISTINGIKSGEIKDANIEKAFSCMIYKANSAGNYNVKINIGKDEFTSTLVVIDDEAPNLIAKDFEIYEDENYSVKDFVDVCTDNSQKDCKIEFLNTSLIDYGKYKEPGTYAIKLAAYDNSNNRSEVATVNLTIKKIIYYQVSFNSNGGSAIESQTIREGETMSYPKSPTKEGYIFEGWYYNNKEFDTNTPINSDITLIAKWTKKQTPTGGGGSAGGGGSSSGGGGSSSGGGNSNQCIKYNDVYEDVSIYNYHFTNGTENDCMNTTSYKNNATDLMKQYYSEIKYDYEQYYLNGKFCNGSIDVRGNTSVIRATGNRIIGYKLTVSVSCSGSNEHVYELHCNSKNSCTYY